MFAASHIQNTLKCLPKSLFCDALREQHANNIAFCNVTCEPNSPNTFAMFPTAPFMVWAVVALLLESWLHWACHLMLPAAWWRGLLVCSGCARVLHCSLEAAKHDVWRYFPQAICAKHIVSQMFEANRKTTRFVSLRFSAASGPFLHVMGGMRLARTLLLRCWPGLRRAPHGFRAGVARTQIRRKT